MPKLSRRTLLTTLPAAGLAVAGAGFAVAPGGVDDTFPTQPGDLAREMVAVSHGNLARVKELLAERPSLARATWDWGFGDWETALGAASHVGHREIAELLIAHGARPDLFAAAMLGWLDVVKAAVVTQAGVQRILGPHGIPLLAHARAGGEAAAPVAAYLESVGGADERTPTEPLADDDLRGLLGTYRYGDHPDQVIVVKAGRSGLAFERQGRAARGLSHVGGRAFFPAGAPAVRIRFTPKVGSAAELTVHDPGLVLVARRVPGA